MTDSIDLNITEDAQKQAIELIEQQDGSTTESVGLRMFVQQGGCAGLSYGLRFDYPEDDDHTFETEHGLICIIDNASLKYIEGSTLKFHSGLQNTGFEFTNPNATSECGCGESFRT